MRTLHYGDPEPDHNTRWLDADGFRWAHTYDGWITLYGEEGVEWSSLHSDHFPMTDVTR